MLDMAKEKSDKILVICDLWHCEIRQFSSFHHETTGWTEIKQEGEGENNTVTSVFDVFFANDLFLELTLL